MSHKQMQSQKLYYKPFYKPNPKFSRKHLLVLKYLSFLDIEADSNEEDKIEKLKEEEKESESNNES